MLVFSQLPAITGGKIIQCAIDRPIEHLLLDSRKLVLASNSLFFALKGQRHDSHQFIPAVYAQGVRQFIVEQEAPATYQQLQGANILQVPNSIEALQQLAAHHRSQYTLPVLAITGSNGKTIVKEWLSQLLPLQYTVVKSPKSYNSQTGVPLSVWQLHDTHQYGIFEAGISLPGEMAKLEQVLQPTVGLFTNIGPAHDQGFATQQQKLQEKALLFKNCSRIHYCLDHTPIHQVLQKQYHGKAELVTWSWQATAANYQVQRRLLPTSTQTEIIVTTQQQQHTFLVPFQDAVSLENVVHCIVFLLHEGSDPSLLQAALAKLSAVPMRLTVKQGINNCQVIDDTYNNDLVGLQVALDFMAQQKQSLKRTVVLSDLLQTGIKAEKLYPQIAQLLQAKHVDRVIGIGEEITTQAAAFAKLAAQFYPHTEAFLQEARQPPFSHELILVKGARRFGLERVVNRLQQKIHSTVLEVNLEAVTHNLNFFRSQLTPGTRLMAVVKALAYGSSSFEIAHLLQYHRVDYLAVAYADEGVLLRENGITLPIMVMNPTPESFHKLLAYDLAPEVYSLKLLQALRDFLTFQDQPIDIHLKLETGMHRLGFSQNELDTLVSLLRATPQLRVVGIMSHLAAAGDAQQDAYTQQQLALFMRLAQHIEKSLGIRTLKHVLNSVGTLRFPDYHLDMVRMGIGLYGIGMEAFTQQPLEVVSTLKTVISQLKVIPSGSTVGYGRQGVATEEMRIATIAIGYADGFNRALGNGRGHVWINGHRAPVVGHVCMDMSMVDVTHIPATEGDEVIIFGPQQPITEMAAAMQTIASEVLTNISERVKRVYYIP